MGHPSHPSRREFLKVASATVAAPYVITSTALGNQDVPAASDRIVMGGIGIGNMGRGDQGAFLGRSDVQYVAVSDVREGVRNQAKGKVDERYKNSDCQAYNDFRELLARPDIDAVHVATPDHWHAIMVIEACRQGKDVYCQKPETRTLREGPLMVEAARRYSRVVSGGSQRVLGDYRKIVDPCWGGEMGTIKSINVNVGPLSQLCNLPEEDVPAGMDWDMWLGPAPWAPYNGKRCDGNFGTSGGSWRSYIDYSGGGMTDWGAHHFGGATFAVDVREMQPEEVVFHNDNGRQYLAFRYPNGLLIYHNRPDTGNLHVEGTPDEKLPAKPIPSYKGTGGIYGDFIECVKTRERPFRDIELAVNTVALSHLGIIAYTLQRSLKWDAAQQQFPDDAEANRFLDRGASRAVATVTAEVVSVPVSNMNPLSNGARYMLDQAFDALKTYDWGTDKKVLDPIEAAVVTTHDDATARKELEMRLLAVLKADVPRDATDYVCRKLRVVGTADSVPALAAMLAQEELAHMARYALERIPAPEAAAALRDALPKLEGALKVGVIGSLGSRKDTACAPTLVGLLGDTDPVIVRSAALALGAIGAPEAAKALQAVKAEDASVQCAVTDATLACAEALLAAGKKAPALAVYKSLAGADRPKYVRLAATRGMLACAGK